MKPITCLAICLCLGCNNPPQAEPTPQTASTPTLTPSEPEPSSCAPIEQLADMDDRKPVPLQPMMAWHQKQNMMDHLVAIQRITDGLARDDWDEVAAASALIETSPQMQQMCQHMGAGADGFTEMALDFHKQADAIGEAARAKDGKGTLTATAATLQACTTCHATFRQDVVSASEWQERTGSAHDPGAMHQ